MKHLVFIGRWNPLHDGHKYIMYKKYQELDKPLLILVRDTEEENNASAENRKIVIDNWLKNEGIAGKAMIIPDIYGIFYGRKVGYVVEEITDIPDNIKQISGTKIRNNK